MRCIFLFICFSFFSCGCFKSYKKVKTDTVLRELNVAFPHVDTIIRNVPPSLILSGEVFPIHHYHTDYLVKYDSSKKQIEFIAKPNRPDSVIRVPYVVNHYVKENFGFSKKRNLFMVGVFAGFLIGCLMFNKIKNLFYGRVGKNG